MIEPGHPAGLSPLGVLAIVFAVGGVCSLLARPVFASSRFRMVVDAVLGTIGALVTSVILPMFGFGAPNAGGSLAMAFAGAAMAIGLPHLVFKPRQ